MCSLLDYLLLFLKFSMLTLSMCLFAGKNIAQKPLTRKQVFTKSAAETLKQDVKSVKS